MTKAAATFPRIDQPILCRTLPFALFMAFIGIDELLRWAASHGLQIPATSSYYLYPVKALSVAVLLFLYRTEYKELRLQDFSNLTASLAACGAGLVTFALWIYLDWTMPVTGTPAGFDPSLLPAGPTRVALTVVRAAGAVLVVPLMEELFWRSFLLRYLVNPQFESVPLGHFTWASFAISTVLFGLEHHYFIAGMVAGAIYNTVLYKTRSLAQCVFAHAVTNLALACYVVATGNWRFW